MSLFLMAGIDDKSVESPILSLARSVDRVANELDLAQMSHTADLLWILGELKGTIATWRVDDEFHSAVAKERVQHLVSSLSEKVKGD